MNRRDFFKFLAKGAAIVGAAGVFGFPVEVKEFSTNDILPKADDTDPDLNDVFNGSFSGWCIMSETVDGATIREMYEKSKSLFLPNEKAQKEMSDLGIEYSTQSGTHWPNDEDIETIELCTNGCDGTIAVLAGDMITTDGGITWTTLELGLDKDDKIIKLDYVFGQIYLTTLKDRYFLSKDCKNFIEYYPDDYYIKVGES